MKNNAKKYLVNFLLGIILFLGLNLVSPTLAQFPRPDAVAVKVYQMLPSLPKENQYTNLETGNIVSNNTLLSRFIRYHQYIKNRPLTYRLDWQLTFADYLKVNETIFENRYPGNSTLTINPLENDRNAIAKLTRIERNQIIDTLLEIYNPKSESSPQKPATDSTNNNNSPKLPQPGDAELLSPSK